MKNSRHAIKNRQDLKLVVQIDTPDNPKDLVFITHGQGGFIEQKHIEAFAQAFLENNFRVVRFDATHALGESDGDMIDVTYTSYIEDLEDVIVWTHSHSWFQLPFALCGQSMGAQSVTWYAQMHPEEIKFLVPIAPPINYDLYIKTLEPDYKKDWQERGYQEVTSRSKPGLIKKVGWGVNEDLKNYDLLPKANKLTMPVLFMAGEFDKPSPYENQKALFDAIPSKHKNFIIIKDAEHSFRNSETDEYGQELEEARLALSNWIRNINR